MAACGPRDVRQGLVGTLALSVASYIRINAEAYHFEVHLRYMIPWLYEQYGPKHWKFSRPPELYLWGAGSLARLEKANKSKLDLANGP